MKSLSTGFLCIALGAIVYIAIVPAADAPGFSADTPIRTYIEIHGETETGAINLVSAIYLGYRLYDTLGEGIVLLLAVTAVMFFLESHA
jgi:multisubunit Na+/H+ antiporter MnhB subunit